MKFSVGYQLPRGGRSLVNTVREFRHAVGEVYFAWPTVASGRAPLPPESRAQLEADLLDLCAMDVRLNLLFNASCYGPEAFSNHLAEDVVATIDHVHDLAGVDVVTTMSPMIAALVRERHPRISRRASVNMKLGTVRALEYVADLFDGFTVQREYNRDLAQLSVLHDWCRREGKHMQLLANSGCLAHCAVQTFHDNLVAHEAEADHGDSVAGTIPGSCWQVYRDRREWVQFLLNTWIRPEDAAHCEPYADSLKLATRMHTGLHRVVRAYAQGHFVGNLAELLEPGHAALFVPWVFDNARFPASWFERITAPGAPEQRLAYAREVLRAVLVDTSKGQSFSCSAVEAESRG